MASLLFYVIQKIDFLHLTNLLPSPRAMPQQANFQMEHLHSQLNTKNLSCTLYISLTITIESNILDIATQKSLPQHRSIVLAKLGELLISQMMTKINSYPLSYVFTHFLFL